jgi:predicted Zn finger-like uncharacterized protein
MIVTCPSCGKKYQIPDEKIGKSAKRLRCRGCSEVFIVHPSKAADTENSKKKSSGDDGFVRAARLARVLASDMLIYNREVVERARIEGNLAQVLESEILRSWQLWKSRFPDESEARPGLFREALTEILASGDNCFADWMPSED